MAQAVRISEEMMSKIIMLKEVLRGFYGKYSFVIDYVIKFVVSLIALLVINSKLGYNEKISNPLVTFLLALVCMAVPKGAAVIVCICVILLNLVSLSLEYAVLAFVGFLLMFLFYFMFAPGKSYILILTPLLFMFKLHYVIPVVVGLISGISGIIAVIFGIYVFMVMDFAGTYSVTMSSFGEDGFIQKIAYIIDNTIANKELIILAIVFAAVIVLVHIIKELSANYAWMIAVVTGSVVEAVLVVMSYVVLQLEVDMSVLILGVIVSLVIGVIFQFFVFSVDYSRTEYVQFEDDDYYYYVKAVPKYVVAQKEVKVKKINAYKEENQDEEDSLYHDTDEE